MKTNKVLSNELPLHSNSLRLTSPRSAATRRWVAAGGLCLLLLAARTAPAQLLYWDSNTTTAGAGVTPTGGWDSSSFWNADPTGVAAPGAWTAGATAVFSAGADAVGPFTVTLDTAQVAAGLIFEEGIVTLSGTSPDTNLTFSGAIDVAAGASATLNTLLLGSGGLVKNGAGTLSLGNPSNTFTGDVVVNAGVLAFANDSATTSQLGAAPASVTPTAITINDATLRFTGAIVTFNLNRGITLGGSGGSIDVPTPSGSILLFDGLNGAAISGGTLTKSGPGEIRVYRSTNSFSKLVISGGAFTVGQSTFPGIDECYGAVPTTLVPDAITIQNGATNRTVGSVTVTNSANRGITLGPGGGVFRSDLQALTIFSPITGPGGLRKEGSRVLTLNGSCTYLGDTIINAGTSSAAFNGPNNAPGNLIVNTGTLNLNNVNTFTSITMTGGRINANTNGSTGTGPITISPIANVLFVNASAITPSVVVVPNDFTLNSSAFLIDISANSGRELILNGKISGPRDLLKNNTGSTGALVFGNDQNDFTGILTNNSGTVIAAANNALGSAAGLTIISNNASLAFRGNINYSTPEPVIIQGPGRNSNGAISNDFGNNTFAGPITMAGDSFFGANPGGVLTLTGVIDETGGSRVLTKVGAGTIILTAANTYSGGTIISNGTLIVNGTAGAGSVTVSGGALKGSGTIGGTLTVNAGSVLSPGTSPGTLNTANEVWNGGGSYLWEINDVDAGEGTDPGWDLINVTGGLTINATSGNRFNINITSLDLANAPGNVADFNVSLNYTWTILKTTGGITGFDAAAFNLNTAAFGNAPFGAFSLTLANGGNDLQLHYSPAAVIAAQPQSTTVCAGGTANFNVTAGGGPPFSYQWYFNDTTPIADATNATLSVTNVQAANAGGYSVVVTNDSGSVTSTVATLTVNALTAAVGPVIQTNCVGSTATFTTVASGTGPFTFVWRKDGGAALGEASGTLTIASVVLTDAGTYSVEVTGACNSVTNSATLTVNELTTASALGNQNNCEGTSATFTTTASGTGPFTYVWRKDGGAALGSTSNELTIASVTVADAGTYSVEVSGTCNSVTNSATLTVNTVVVGPVDQTNCIGSTAVFSAVASGVGPFSYVWRKDGGAALGSTSNTLEIAAVTLADAGIYSVEVTGACNSVTNSATLTVNPTVVVGPVNQTNCVGSMAVLSTVASGTGPFAYVWRKDGGAPLGEISGTLTIASVVLADAGTYSVEVTGACDSVTNSATLTVNEVTVASAFSDQTNCAGASVTFTTTAAGTGPLSYVWRKDGGAALSSTSNELTIASVAVADGGVYSVEVTGACNSVTNSATLTVNGLTTASGPGNAPDVCPGSAVTLTTVASGTGPFSYQWSKDGVDIGGATSSSYDIASVATGDAGTYCVAVSGLCNSVTNCATLTVAVGPVITAQPQSVGGVLSNGVAVSVGATGPALSYQWYYNGNALANGGQFSGATASTLIVTNLSCTNNAATLQVIVTNCIGSATSQVAVLTVRPYGAVYFDFATVGQFTNNLPNNGAGDPLTPIPSEVNAGGVNNSRALDLITGSTALSDTVFPGMAYDFSVNGRILRESIMFKLKASANNVNDTVMMLGFASKPSRLDNGDEQVAFMAAQVLGQGASGSAPATGYLLRLRHKVFAGTTVNSVNASASIALVNGNWYKLSMSVTNVKATTANSFSYGATLQDMGPTGLTPGATTHSIASVVANTDLVTDNSLYAAFRTRENAGDDFIDNLSINTVDGAAFFTCQPESRTVLQGRSTTFNAYVDGSPPFTYQWLKNGSPIAGATDWKYTLGAVAPGDAGDYSVQVNGAGGITSSAATLAVTADTVGPVLLSAGSFDGSTIGVCFDEPLDTASATAPGNYSVSGGGSVGFVLLRPDRKSVVLYPSPGVSGAFTVTVSGVNDVYGNTMTAGSIASGNVASHLASVEINGPLPSLSVANAVYTCNDGDFDITAGGADVWGSADQFRYTYQARTNDFDVRVKVAGQTIPNTTLKGGLIARETLEASSRALHVIVSPPWPGIDRYETGQRTTYSGSTASWGSGVANGNRAATAPSSWMRLQRVNNTFTGFASSNGVDWVLIAQTTQVYPAVMQVGLEMVSHVQGRLGTTEFRSYGEFGGYPGAVITITTQPNSTNLSAGQTAVFTVAATVSGAPAGELRYQWQRSDGAGGFTNVPNANAASASFTTTALFGQDSGAEFRCLVGVAGVAGVSSSVATVTVTDTTGPTLVSAVLLAGSTDRLMLVYSEPVSAGTALAPGNYVISNSAGTVFALAGAEFFGNPSTVVLTTAVPLPAGDYVLVVNNVQDLATPANTIAADTMRTVFASSAPYGPVVVEMYEDIGGTATTAALLTSSLFSQGVPTYISYSNLFGFNVSLSSSLLPGTSLGGQDNYGIKAYTYFVPPTNGNYKFWIRSDDVLQLFMNTNGPDLTLPAVIPSSTNSPAAEQVGNVFDDNVNTKYLNFDELNTGLTVTPAQGATVVTAARFSTANDAAERDPITFTLEGTTGSPLTGPWTLIASPVTGLTNAPATATPRLTPGPLIPVTNDAGVVNAVAYTSYRLRFPTIRDTGAANSMQISEIELLDASGRDVTFSGKVLIAENTAFSGNYTVGTTPANSKTNIALVGGQRYYLEALFKEGGGGDGFSVTWTDPAVNTAPANTVFIPASALAYPSSVAPATPVVTELYTGPSVGFNFAGSDLASLGIVTNNAKWGVAPDAVVYQKYFAFQPLLGNTRFDNYAGRIYSYFVAPSNGLYKFYMRSDDASQLYLNTNAVNSTDPAGMTLLGQLTAFTSAYTLVGQNVSLTGGQSYYIEARWKDGTGGDGIAMAVRAQSDTAVPPPIAPVPEIAGVLGRGAPGGPVGISANAFASPTPLLRVGAVTLAGITPANPVAIEGQTVTLTAVGLNGAFPYTLTWLKNGAFVAEGVSYTTPPVGLGDDGAVFTLVASNGFSRATATATLNVITDTTAPTLLSVSGHLYETNVILTFSEALQAATALNAGNYTIPGLTVLSAFVDSSGRRVSLLTSPQTPEAIYNLSVTGLVDNATGGNVIAPVTVPFTAWSTGTCHFGAVYVEVFTNVGVGNVNISSLVSEPRFINNLADTTSYLSTLDYRTVPPLTGNGMDNYGVRITGYFVAPSNGVYRFFQRSDDASQFFMNTNTVSSTDPAGKVMLINVPSANIAYADSRTQSPFIALNGGQLYYIESLVKEAGGGDYLSVTFRGDSSIPPDYEAASGQFFALPPNNPADTSPPLVVKTYSLSGNSLVLEFNELLNANPNLSANPTFDPFTYSVDDGVAVQTPSAITLRPDGKSLLLNLAGLAAGSYTVHVEGPVDLRCNAIVPTNVTGSVFALGQGLYNDGPIGAPTTANTVNPAEPGSANVPVANQLDIVAGGTDIWDAADGMRFAWGSYTGDFDIRVRVESLQPRNNWSKAGLVVRESLAGNSRNLSAVVTSGSTALDGSGAGANDYEAGFRSPTGASTADWGQFRPIPVPYPNAWVRLRRAGTTFLAYWGTDGVNWTQFATRSEAYPGTVFVGLGTTAHNNNPGQTTMAVYHDYSLIFPPTITTQPQDQVLNPGDTAVFNVAAGGTGPLFYQWRRNGANLAGETGTSLTILNAQQANAGNYDVVVSNMNSTVTSVAATLTVQEPPTITTQPQGQTVGIGSNVTFTVVATGTPSPVYQWRKNGTDIAGATSASLALNNAQAADAGSYTVVVSNVVGSVTSSPPAVLRVLVPTTFINVSIQSGKITAGFQTVAGLLYDIEATGSLTPPIIWTPLAINLLGNGSVFPVDEALTTTNRFYRLIVH